MEEYKLLNGWSRDKKRGSSRYDRIPVSIEREMEFTCAQDYVQLIPYDLPEPFTSAQLAKAVQIRKEQAGIVCNILHDLGVMKREGKKEMRISTGWWRYELRWTEYHPEKSAFHPPV